MIVQRVRSSKPLKFILLIPIYVLVLWMPIRYIPEVYYVDWISGFRPATWDILSLRTPYEGHGVYNPPWTFILLIPLALLPATVGAI